MLKTKNISISIYVLLFLCLQLISCEKAPRYTVLSTDETIERNRLYYSITRLVTEVSDKGGNGFGAYIARTGYEDSENTLVLSDFKVRGGTADNGEDAPVEKLRNYGINSREETKFRIIGCNGKIMTLESDYARLELRKF